MMYIITINNRYH